LTEFDDDEETTSVTMQRLNAARVASVETVRARVKEFCRK
jgi:hypothetical protein